MATGIFADISLGGTLGVTFLGVCVSSMLYGVTCLQTFSYYRSAKAKSDGHILHALVAALLIFDSAHQAIVIHAVYNYLVIDFANPFKVITVVWSVPTEIVLNAILALILNVVPRFLTFRLLQLSKRYSLPIIAGVLSLANFGTNLTYAIRGYPFKNIFEAEVALRTQGIAGLSISVATEFFISLSLAYFLHSRRTGLRKSNDIITKLIMLTITTGMLTTLFNVADLIAYVTAHNNLYVLFFNFMLGKLYANALLTSLNSREYVLGIAGDSRAASDHETLKLPRTGYSSRSGQSSRTTDTGRGGPPGIHVQMERFVALDSGAETSTKVSDIAVAV
ncbi:hypothetical protein C8Q79DRAFT_472087 [Trametes meyenii]|nr:hypothetical protein C8Q79DRAFT_472087 [Trametes meyenii]